MNILITGGNGFIGSNLLSKLQQKNYKVLNLSYRDSFPIDIQNIIDFKPKVIIHCGWHGGNNYSDSNSLDQYHKNIPNSIKLLETASIIKTVDSFIGIGSSFEYGNKKCKFEESFSEESIDFYGISKTFFKNYSKIYCSLNKINWTWIRPVYTYGPNDVKTRLIPRTIIKMLKNEKQIKFNSCESIVDYLYIEDFAEAVYEIIKQNKNGVFNICSGNEYKVKDIILMIAKIMNYNEEILFDQIDDKSKPNYICASNKKIIEQTGWIPKINLEEGLHQTISKILL